METQPRGGKIGEERISLSRLWRVFLEKDAQPISRKAVAAYLSDQQQQPLRSS